MTHEDAGPNISHSPVLAHHLQSSSQAAGTRILCITEDPAYTERDILPALYRAGACVEVQQAARGETTESADRGYQDRGYHAILLEAGAHNGGSFQICRQIRNRTRIPIMLVLHGSAREDTLLAYRVGADAYIIAPFDPREFLARLNGLLRRGSTTLSPKI